jgi:hypothetical protein
VLGDREHLIDIISIRLTNPKHERARRATYHGDSRQRTDGRGRLDAYLARGAPLEVSAAMRVYLILVLLAFAAGRAHAEPEAAADSAATGGTRYIASGIESLTFAGGADTANAASIDIGQRLGSSIYAHLAVAAAGSGYVDAHGGVELRMGSVVKGIFGVDTGYQHDARDVDRMVSVEGPYLAPRLGLEIGTPALWLRGTIDWRTTLVQGGGRASAFGLVAGHDF